MSAWDSIGTLELNNFYSSSSTLVSPSLLSFVSLISSIGFSSSSS